MTIKNVYGVEMIYPHCDKSKTFADINKTKTLTKEVIYLIKKLGYNFTVINERKI
mgnify:FL=1